MLEQRIEEYLVEKIIALGGKCIKINSPTTRGLPDRLVIRDGIHIWIELKSSVGKVRAYQRHMHTQLRNVGANVRVINSKGGVDDLCLELLSLSTNKKLRNMF